MQIRRLNLDFLEGIIIGIYGNWLISLIDKINFETLSPLYIVFLSVSFTVFAWLFIWTIVKGHPISFGKTIVVLAVHFSFWFIPYTIQGVFSIEKSFFSFVGATLFLALIFAEMARTR